MGHSNYKLTDEQKKLLTKLVSRIVDIVDDEAANHGALNVYDNPEHEFDNNKFTAMVWYVGDQLSAY